jgi:septum formation protein
MLIEKIKNYNVLLATKSPRRQQLLKETGIDFQSVNDREIDESIPSDLDKFRIPVYLSEKKSDAYTDLLQDNTILITADTIVWFNGKVMGKPESKEEAIEILESLSGNAHDVITGVTLRTKYLRKSFYSHSEVYFATLKKEEILYYIDTFKPYDKAGAYGYRNG